MFVSLYSLPMSVLFVYDVPINVFFVFLELIFLSWKTTCVTNETHRIICVMVLKSLNYTASGPWHFISHVFSTSYRGTHIDILIYYYIVYYNVVQVSYTHMAGVARARIYHRYVDFPHPRTVLNFYHAVSSTRCALRSGTYYS